MKKFISFADSRLREPLQRIHQQAEAMHFFDSVKTLDESYFDESFKSQYKDKLSFKVKGFGYWCWKAYIMLRELEDMPEGSQLYYCDAGCHLNPRGIARLREYSTMLESCPLGIIAFSIEHIEKQYTKGDVFAFLNVLERKDITDTHQVQAGIVFIRKCKASVNFIKEWMNCWQTDFSLIDDSPSRIPNFPDFITPRHDQSVFSCLCKLRGALLLSSRELEPPPGSARDIEAWKKLKESPILAMRDRYGKSDAKKLRKYKFISSLPLGPISRAYQKKLDKAYETKISLMNPPPYMLD